MKKTFWSLAALMLMAAPVMTSCSNDLDEAAPVEEVKENVVTLTIKMPVQTETRVGINDGTLKLTGWEQNDVVKVYHFEYPDLSEGITFTCTNPSEGTFTGTLPAGKSLSDYNFAVYGRDVEFYDYAGYVVFHAGEVHDNLKDCICLGGPIVDGGCTMSIYNNVIKVTNNGDEVTGAWHRDWDFTIPYGVLNEMHSFCPDYFYESDYYDVVEKITIPSGVSYIFMPMLDGAISLLREDETTIIPEKDFDEEIGKLYKVTIN